MFSSFAQTQMSRNGYSLPVHTTIQRPLKALLVFVQRKDINGNIVSAGSAWPAAQVPLDADDYFDNTIGVNGPQKYLSKYFWEASFGQLVITGDYLAQPVILEYLDPDPPHTIYDAIGPRYLMFGNAAFANQSYLTDFDNFTACKSNNTYNYGEEKFEMIQGVPTYKN